MPRKKDEGKRKKHSKSRSRGKHSPASSRSRSSERHRKHRSDNRSRSRSHKKTSKRHHSHSSEDRKSKNSGYPGDMYANPAAMSYQYFANPYYQYAMADPYAGARGDEAASGREYSKYRKLREIDYPDMPGKWNYPRGPARPPASKNYMPMMTPYV